MVIEEVATLCAADLPALPIIREALEENGISVEAALANTAWQHKRSPLTTSATRMDMPFIMFDADGGSIDWGRPDVCFKFSRRRGEYRFWIRVAATPLPHSAVEGLVGQRMTRLIDLAGSDGYLVEEVLQEAGNIKARLSLSRT